MSYTMLKHTTDMRGNICTETVDIESIDEAKYLMKANGWSVRTLYWTELSADSGHIVRRSKKIYID